jgi:hypothetical protein
MLPYILLAIYLVCLYWAYQSAEQDLNDEL